MNRNTFFKTLGIGIAGIAVGKPLLEASYTDAQMLPPCYQGLLSQIPNTSTYPSLTETKLKELLETMFDFDDKAYHEVIIKASRNI